MSIAEHGAVLTSEVRAMKGAEGPEQVAPEPVDASSIRRIAQAIMDDDPLYFDAEYAAGTRFGEVVAPPLFPLHAIRRHAGTPDPLDAAAGDPDFDGVGNLLELFELPPLSIPLKRLLNGGNSVEISALARIGDTITAKSAYEDIYEKEGRSGPLVFIIVRTDYTAVRTGAAPRHLLRSRLTFVLR